MRRGAQRRCLDCSAHMAGDAGTKSNCESDSITRSHDHRGLMTGRKRRVLVWEGLLVNSHCSTDEQGWSVRRSTHLDQPVNLGRVRAQELRLRLSEGALRGDVSSADLHGGEAGQRAARQRPGALAHRLQHVQEAIVARGREHRWAQLQL